MEYLLRWPLKCPIELVQAHPERCNDALIVMLNFDQYTLLWVRIVSIMFIW